MQHTTLRALACASLLATSAACVASDVCRVALRPTDPTWNRPKDTNSTTATSGCNGVATDSQNDSVPYRIVKFRTTASEHLSLSVTSLEGAGSRFDPFIGVYCSSFAAASPLSNIITLDDDSGGWPNPAISTGRNITLTPNVDYFLIVSAYSTRTSAQYGLVSITLNGAAKFTTTLPGCCKADFNQDGTATVQDIFDMLNAWFAGSSRADINGGGLSVQDIFDFLNAWFVGC